MIEDRAVDFTARAAGDLHRRRRTGPPAEAAPSGPTAISAYLVRWGYVSQLDDGRWFRTPAGCFDGWLAAEPRDVPIVLNHGRDFTGRDAAVLERPGGHWRRFEVDAVGLLAHGELDDSPLGVRTAEEIRAGRLVATSFHGQGSDLGPTGQTRDGADLLDLVDAVLLEGGPTPTPADPGAVIVSLGGRHLRDAVPVGPGAQSMDEALSYLESVTGRRVTPADIEARQRRAREAAAARVDAIEVLARRLAEARRGAESAWRCSRAPWRHPSDLGRMREFDRRAADLEELLRDAAGNDAGILAELAARYDIPPAVSPLQRLQSLAA